MLAASSIRPFILSIPVCGGLLFGAAASATAQYRFDVWTSDNGLPQNSINSIIQTRDGYLWLATNAGLVRYDGVAFTVFNTANSKGLRDNSINRLCEDGNGDLWLGTEGGLVIKRTNGFTTYTTADGLPSNRVFDVQAASDGRLVIGTSGGFVCRKNGRISECDLPSDQSNASITQELQDSLFHVHGDRLHLLRRGELITVQVPESVARRPIRSVYQDREGAVWIATLFGLSRIKNGAVTSYTARDGLPQSNVVTYCEDRQGTLWLGTANSGLVQFKGARFKTLTTADGLSGNAVRSIYEDREGTLWIGTNGFGLNRLKTPAIKAYSEGEGLAGKETYPICEDRGGNVWIGVGGLHRFANGLFTRYPMIDSDYARKRKLDYDTAISLCEDDGGVWIANAGGAYYMKNGVFARVDLAGFSTSIYTIYKDRAGNLWAGTAAGLVKNNHGSRTVYTITDGLAGNDVKAILEDDSGALWVGTYGGLSRYQNGQFTSYTDENGLASNHVRALYQDNRGVLWIGTYDGGLSRLKDGRLTKCTADDGLFDNGVFQILEDDRGNFWMSCNRGIYRVARQQLEDFADGKLRKVTCIAYGRDDGMLTTECNGGRQPAGVKTHDGKLWFPTMNGVAVVDPKLLSTNEDPPPIRIEEAVLDHNEIDFDRGVEVTSGHYNLEIHYTALSFIKSQYINFRYRLEGLDNDWIDAGTRRVVYYSYLPPGSYTFRVIAANSDGVWNTEGASIRVVVVPPFWRTWWFTALVIVAVTGLALLYYQRRVAALRRAQALQEAFSRQLIESQENERKRIAAELHDSIGQSLLVIKNQAVLGQADAQDPAAAREQFDDISSAASGAIEEVRSIAHNLRPYQLDRLGLTMAIKSIVNKLSDSSTTRFSADVDNIDGLLSPEGEINLYRIVQESVNNIVKHSEATEARIAIKREDNLVDICIEDNGRGFGGDDTTQANKRHCGFGLIGISERARILRGKCTIRSAPGRGTRISVSLQLTRGLD